METFKIKDILVEHSNALRELLKASRSYGNDAEPHVQAAVKHVKEILDALKKYKKDEVPPKTKERAEQVIEYLTHNHVEEGRTILLEMGRAFDDFLKS